MQYQNCGSDVAPEFRTFKPISTDKCQHSFWSENEKLVFKLGNEPVVLQM